MRAFALAALAAALSAAAWAQEVAPLEVSYGAYGEVETPLTATPGDPANGAAVMVDRGKGNCIACHAVTALQDQPFHGEVGPSLDGVGARWSEADLRGIVADAKMMFPGTVMPGFYKTTGYIRPGDAFTGKAAATDELPPLLTAQEVEDVVAFLTTLEEE
jgi:sulfur-oxidizing protein SoxX